MTASSDGSLFAHAIHGWRWSRLASIADLSSGASSSCQQRRTRRGVTIRELGLRGDDIPPGTPSNRWRGGGRLACRGSEAKLLGHRIAGRVERVERKRDGVAE